MVINDYFDWECDRVNKPEKWKKFSKYPRKIFLYYSLFLFFAGILLSSLLPLPAFILAIANSIILFAYSSQLKRFVFLKNVIVSYLVASSFLYGGLISGNPIVPVIFSAMAFFSNLGREIIKDISDIEGDKKRKVKTLPMMVGKLSSTFLAISFVIAAVLLLPTPYLLGILSWYYLIALLPCIIVLVYSCFLSLVSPEKSHKYLKLAMLLALLAFFVGRLF
jgi:geranylgeranylglycerol-phosphate geranylgeranyltransferase